MNKILSCALLVTGTTIGAGMLGIPLSAIGLGYWTTVGLMVLIWLITMGAAFLILEVNLADRTHLHFNTMAINTLGKVGQWVMTFSFLGLLYSLTIAYINGGSSLLSVGIQYLCNYELGNIPCAIIFTFALGVFIYISTRATDLLNIGFMTIKFILLIIVAFLCVPKIDVVNLMQSKTVTPDSLWLAIPVFFTAFGYQPIIPSITQYANFNVHVLQRAILLGSIISFAIYLLWQTISFGIIPSTGPNSLATLDKNSIGHFIELIGHLVNKPSIAFFVNSFAQVALITSFLGVSLCIFDFIRDILPKNKFNSRLNVALLTFVAPLLLAVLAPQGFTQLLSYAAVFFAILGCILPPLMVFKIRKNANGQLRYKTPGGWFTPILVFITGCIIIFLVLSHL